MPSEVLLIEEGERIEINCSVNEAFAYPPTTDLFAGTAKSICMFMLSMEIYVANQNLGDVYTMLTGLSTSTS